MKIELIEKEPVFNHITLEFSDEYGLKDNVDLLEDQSQIEKPDFTLDTRCLHINGVYIYFFKKQYRKERMVEVRSDAPYIQLHFELYGGATCYKPHHPDEPEININYGEYTLFHLPRLNGHLFSPACDQAFSVEIEISQQWLKRKLGDDLAPLEDFGESIKNNRAAILGHKSYPITTNISKGLYQLYQTSMRGMFKKIYVEGKLLEILSLFLHQVKSESDVKRKHISNSDAERLHEIKTILAKDLSRTYTIEELSSLAFMNRTKLQRCFQMLFGRTINEYIVDLRMETAYQLLLEISESNLKIEDISNRVGYKHYNYFSTAFKKRYGKSPRQFVNQGKSTYKK